MKIKAIDTFQLRMTFIQGAAPHMLRAQTHGESLALCKIELENGAVGWGDGGDGADFSEFVGRNAVELLHTTSNPLIQMACYDAVGRALDVPANALMGRQNHEDVPFAYWTIDLPPEVFAQQAARAASLGYRAYKFKCRPWWDPIEQVAAASDAVPDDFRFWLDFNGHLRNSDQAIPILKELEKFDSVGGVESPIPQRDVDGYKRIRAEFKKPIAIHYGSGCCHVRSDPTYDPGTSAETQIINNMSEGFVLGGDVDTTIGIDRVCQEHKKVFWIQHVGTTLRAAFVTHLACVCQQSKLSHLSAHDLWEEDLLVEPLAPVNARMKVPEGPGLGVEPDEGQLDKLVSQPPREAVRKISTVVYPSGDRWNFSNEQQRHEAFYFGEVPGFETGIKLEVLEDDGSEEFARMFEQCKDAPVKTD